MKKARFLLVGVFIILLIILFSQTCRTEGFADLSKPQKCISALKNIITAVDMPYIVQNNPNIFGTRIDSALKNLISLKCTSRDFDLIDYDLDFDLIDFFQVKNAFYKVDDAFNKFCSDNPKKCDMGMRLRNRAIDLVVDTLKYIH